MNPFFFGSAPKSLFGVYHPPKATQARAAGVVLCYPFGQEYMRAHRAFRQLALLLSKSGFHVLRFEYSGTGDSAGETNDVSLANWVDDARTAADELKDTAEVSRVSFVGLRLGAAIAAMAAAGRSDVEDVVLWDPAVRGSDYLNELLEERTDSVGHARNSGVEGGTLGVMGFPLTQSLRDELGTLNMLNIAAPATSSRRLVIASHERAEYTELGRHNPDGTTTKYQHVPSEGSWNEVDDYGGVLIPVFLIQAIVAHLSQVLI